MISHPTEIAGIVIPSTNPLVLVMVGAHVIAGVTCVLAGLVAMLSQKVPSRNTRAGYTYYGSLIVVVLTMTVLAIVRWPEDNLLWTLGAGSFAGAQLARWSITHRRGWRATVHIIGMGSSYTLLLIAFYVDNGKHLPIWKDLPPTADWLLPTAIGLGLIARAIRSHPFAKAERQSATARP